MLRHYTTLVLPLLLAVVWVDTALAGGVSGESAHGSLPLSCEAVAGSPASRQATSVKWEGNEYDVETGLDVLMRVVRDPERSANDRELALLDVSRLGTHLKHRLCLDELRKRFDSAGELEKSIILTCFKGAQDPRAIELFTHVLDHGQSMKLRLRAAGGLAQWNVRRGGAELVKLLDSDAILSQPARVPYVRHNALELLRTNNRLKGWGYPDEKIWRGIESRTDLNNDEKAALFFAEEKAEIKKWWAGNEHRFPEWRPGDPLPETEVSQPKPGNREDE